MNKIIFVTSPDEVQGETYAIKNYTKKDIRSILNNCDRSVAFYLIEKDSSSKWLNSIIKQSKIIFDCSQSSIEEIIKNVR